MNSTRIVRDDPAGSVRRSSRISVPGASRPRATLGRSRGQSLVEFALILPLMLALVGATLDFSRVYQVWMRLQAVTRDTAEYVATNPAFDSAAAAQGEVDSRICTAMADTPSCPAYVRPGALVLVQTSPSQPIWSAKVTAQYDFQTLFLWPFIRGLTGAEKWTIQTDVTYEILRRAE